jgi:hypothetical protein
VEQELQEPKGRLERHRKVQQELKDQQEDKVLKVLRDLKVLKVEQV